MRTTTAQPARTGRAGWHRWIAGSLVGLSFLLYAMVEVAVTGGSTGAIVTFEVFAALFGATYIVAPILVGGFARSSQATPRKLAALAVMVALTVPMILAGGTDAASLWVYVGVAAAVMMPLRRALPVAIVLAVAMVALPAVTHDEILWELAITLVALTLWMSSFAGKIRLTIELRATREELARTAVEAERSRIGRDLHDILGHSLTAIAVKAGLARRLVDRDATAAAAEIADVETLAREALADVRATVAGYRDVSVAGELAVARSVLAAAGISTDIPTAVDDLTPAAREAFGYVIREAITNVVRHSGARSCRIELTPTCVRITDDGTSRPGARRVVRPGRGEPGGGGLRGLSERLDTVGGSLRSGPLPDGGFQLTATVPATSREPQPGPRRSLPDSQPADAPTHDAMPHAAPAATLDHAGARGGHPPQQPDAST